MSDSVASIVALATSFLIPAVFTPLLCRWLISRGQVDLPDQRRNHAGLVPRGGGLMLLAGMIMGLILITPWGTDTAAYYLASGGMVFSLAALGAIDDARGLGVRIRIMAQVSIAIGVFLIWGDVGSVRLSSSFAWTNPWLISVLAVLAFVWVINLHNFMDGSDGLAALQAVWSGAAYGVIFFMHELDLEFALACLLAVSSIGFLIWNRPKARIFLGDSGSLLIGGLVAWFAIRSLQTGSASLAICVLISSVFVVDSTATLLARLGRGEQWYTPHRCHAYQRLIDQGWSHARVLLSYGAASVGLVLPAFALSLVYPSVDLILTLGVVGVLVAAWWRIQSADNGEQETHDPSPR